MSRLDGLSLIADGVSPIANRQSPIAGQSEVPSAICDTRCAIRERLFVTGVVQGVGFRPFVYGLAMRWLRDHGDADEIAPPVLMEGRVTALRRAGTDVEYHRYPGVGHGFGLGVGTSAEEWIAAALTFWEKHIE